MKKIYIIPEVEVIESDLTDGIMLELSSNTEANPGIEVLGREDGLEDSWDSYSY